MPSMNKCILRSWQGVVFAVFALAWCALAHAAATLTAGQINVIQDGTYAQLPIEISSSTPISGVQFDLTFDPALLAATATTTSGPALGIHAASAANVSPGVIRVVIAPPTTGNEALSSGVFVQLPFTVTGSAAPGVPYVVSLTNVSLGDPASAAINGTLANGAVTLAPQVVAPIHSPGGGVYLSTPSIALTTATSGATIYYTLDGSVPTTSSAVYLAPIQITGTTTVRAIAVLSGYSSSAVSSATYTIDPNDLDGDGIPDSIDPDIDGDGMPNDWELAHGLDPYDPLDANADLDGDGLTNLQEYQNGSDPTVADGSGVNPVGFHEYGWTQIFGGLGSDYGNAVAIDADNNMYVVGYFQQTIDFDSSPGVDQHTSLGGNDIFVTRRNADGSYGWTWTGGGTGADYGYAVAVDSVGSVYVVGAYTGSVDFDPANPQTDSVRAAVGSSPNAFVVKLDASGVFQWVRTVVGTSNGRGVGVDSNDNVYISGDFYQTVNFDPQGSGDVHNAGNSYDVFVTRLGSNGSYGWTRTVHGSGSNRSYGGLSIDSSDNVYIVGAVAGTVDFDPQGVGDIRVTQGQDAFVGQWHANGSYGWARLIGGSGTDVGLAVAANALGDVYVTGSFQGTVDFDPGAGVDQRISAGSGDVFVARFDENGAYVWVRTFGGSGNDSVAGIAADNAGAVYVTGRYTGTVDFDPGVGIDQHTSMGAATDIFITQIESDGSYGWTAAVGAGLDDAGQGLALDSYNNLYVTGFYGYTSTNAYSPIDFDPGEGVDLRGSSAKGDVFLSRYNYVVP